MREAEHSKGIDALLFDGVPNNLDESSNDTIVRPSGFVGFPQQPTLPPEYQPFNYPVIFTIRSSITCYFRGLQLIYLLYFQPMNNASPPNPITSPTSTVNSINNCPLPPASTQDSTPPPYSYNIPPEEKKPNNVPAANRNDFKPNNTV